MSVQIEDGTGSGKRVIVDSSNRLNTRAITEAEFDRATIEGNAFNINTEFLTITNSTETPLLYLKNNEQEELVIAAWFIGTDNSAGTATKLSLLKAYGNPTGGTIIDSGNNVEAVNRSIGSTRNLDCDIKSGGDAFTFTTNTTPVLFQTQGSENRSFGNVNLSLKKGGSILITMQKYGLTSLDIYTGFQVYKTNINI